MVSFSHRGLRPPPSYTTPLDSTPGEFATSITFDTGGEFGTQLRPFQLGDSPLKLPGEFATSITFGAATACEVRVLGAS